MEIIGIKEIMKECKCSRRYATRLLSDPTCPTLPRFKGSPYRVERQAFEDWLRNPTKYKK